MKNELKKWKNKPSSESYNRTQSLHKHSQCLIHNVPKLKAAWMSINGRIDRLWYSQSVMNYSLDELFGLILFWYREVSIICWKKKLQKLIFIKLHPDFYKKRTKKFLKMLMVFKLTVWTGFDLEPVIWDIMSLFLFLWCPRTIRPYNSKSL